MRSLVLDELLGPEMERVRAYLDEHAQASGLEDLYWIPLTRELWNERQRAESRDELTGEERRFRLGVEVGRDWVRFELLVRSEGLRNEGGGLADEAQTLFVLRWAEEMGRRLELPAG